SRGRGAWPRRCARGQTNPRRSRALGPPPARASPRWSGSQPGAHDGDEAQEASAAEDACQATAWPPEPAVVGSWCGESVEYAVADVGGERRGPGGQQPQLQRRGGGGEG